MQSKSRTKGSIRCLPWIRTKQRKKTKQHNTKTPVQAKYEAGTAGCRHIPCFKENKHFLTDDSQVSFPIVHLDISSILMFLECSHTIFILTSSHTLMFTLKLRIKTDSHKNLLLCINRVTEHPWKSWRSTAAGSRVCRRYSILLFFSFIRDAVIF